MPQQSWKQPPAMEIDPKARYAALMRTSEGDITIELFADEAPQTVNNFVFLARQGYYDNVIFHRTIKGFMIQGGDPTGTGRGGPGYQFRDEPVRRRYTRGILAMANAGPNTNGSQFFIMHADYNLPPNYTIFGQVTDGLDVVDRIATAPTRQGGRENSEPVDPARIESVTIQESPAGA
jgi:cyclophilin family peptidyl-prolyl cis-trans isomerase